MAKSTQTSGKYDVGHFGVDQTQLPPFEAGPIDLRSWFPHELRHQPMELEIGSGKGTFLTQQAALTPGVNYLGIEYANAYYRHAADRARRHGLENVRLLHTEAGFFVRNYVPDHCFQQLHVYFPDPWPKKRHHKRRLIQAPFLEQAHRILLPPEPANDQPGCIRIATDHTGYFEWMIEEAQKVSHLFERLPFESPESAGRGELVGTNFERKYRREGRPFNAMILRKR